MSAGVATAEAPALPAAGSSFYLGMRVLPRPEREAMFAVYAFCRAVDDVADDDEGRAGSRAARLEGLARWRADIDALYAGTVAPNVAALAEPVRRFGLARDDFHAVIDGMAMDAEADIRAPDEATLDLYCDRVASAVGRLSVKIFGLEPEAGKELAHHLGRALQLTNILRDLDEDAARGRLYLPREALERAGLGSLDPASAIADPRVAEVCAGLAARAQAHFRMAERVMDGCPRRGVKAPRLMAAVYGSVLDGLVARGWAAPRAPVRKSRLKILAAALRYGFG